MNTSKWLMLLIGIMVGGLILASFVPVLVSVQEKTGDEVTYTNNYQSVNHYQYDYVDSVVLVATASEIEGNSYDFLINGKSIELIGDYMLGVVSDGFVMQIGTLGQFAYSSPLDPYSSQPNLSPSTYPIVTLTMENGNFVLMGGETEIVSGTYTWVVTFVDGGRYIAHNGSAVGTYCHETPNDFIMCGGGYTSGDLDTFYAYADGKFTIGVSDYTPTLNWSVSKVNGTSDVYNVTSCNITISDGETTETYTPYRCLFLHEVDGHKTSGTMYDLLGLLPLVAGVGLLMSAVVYFLRRY